MALSMRQDDYEDLLRNAAEHLLTQHITARLAQNGCKSASGSPAALAKKLVGRWQTPSVKIFWSLARAKGATQSQAELAKSAGCSVKTASSFWTRALRKLSIRGNPHDRAGETKTIRLFRLGHECFWAATGVKLQISGEMLPFDMARHITDSTAAQTLASVDNYNGASGAQEADASKTEEERTRARRWLVDSTAEKDETALPQQRLFDGTGE